MSKTINPFGKDIVRVEGEFCGRKITFETGRLAFQAQGAVMVTCGETVIMGIAGVSDPVAHLDYFPLMIDYEEKMYATGKISGSRFIKREGRPSEDAILTSRLIDRPIRPLFPKGYKNEVQGIAMVLSVDPEVKPDIIAMAAISAAINITGAPFDGPIGGVRIGLIDDKLVAYPNTTDMAESRLDLVVAGTKDAIMMVEAGANEIDEDTMSEALQLAHKSIQPIVALQEELRKKLGVEKEVYEGAETDESIVEEVNSFLKGKLGEKAMGKNKLERDEKLKAIKTAMLEELVGENEDDEKDERAYKDAFEAVIKKEIRRSILEDGVRPDGRKSTDIRPLSSEVGVLPTVHGSSIFTRGATQALNITTLAPLSYAQLIDTMERDEKVNFFHHYNFPGFSTGEVQRPRSAGRREIGHGHLAERAIRPMLPSEEDFPYTIRVVSELTSSNGSTSMAAVCSTALSLMDAGVPIKKPVSGIAMGLMSDGAGTEVILSDIQGAEDFAGDMDFKVAGTEDGITALQMDIKIKGLSPETMSKALNQAKEGRQHILDSMLATLPAPRKEMHKNAPRVESIKINPDKIRDVIGKGGETINGIIAETGAEIDINDDGLVMIFAANKDAIDAARSMVESIVEEPEVGKIYNGTVVKILDFGAFVNILPGTDGMVHVSEMKDERVEHPNDVVSEGDKVKVKLVAIDDRGRLNLSMKQAQ